MPAETYAFNGQWRKAKQIYIHNGGVWVEAKEVWKKDGGVWRLVFTRNFVFNDTAAGFNYNVYNSVLGTGQWDGLTPVVANITVSSNLGSATSTTIDWNTYLSQNPDVAAAGASYRQGVVAFAQMHYCTNGQFEGRVLPYTFSPASLDTGNLPAGSMVNVFVSSGCGIVGAGGIGGYGGTYVVTGSSTFLPSTAGSKGGPAITARCPVTIYNNGIIGGGGGGGGGGAGAGGGQGYDDPGGGGGGGAGIIQGLGGQSARAGTFIGATGTIGHGGAGGFPSATSSKEWASATAGGVGGDMGAAGAASAASNGGPGLPGGPPGAAIEGSANVTWQVYGDVRGPLA